MLALDPQRNALEGRATGGFVASGELESWPGRQSSNAVVHALLSGHLASTVTARPPLFCGKMIYSSFVQRAGVFSVSSFVQGRGVLRLFVQKAGVFSGCSYRGQGCSLAIRPLEPRYRVTTISAVVMASGTE